MTKSSCAIASMWLLIGCGDSAATRDAPNTRSVGVEQPPTGIEQRTRIISDETVALNVLLNSTTVVCSSADYSDVLLKVGIPQIANVTLFDHRNAGVDAPCMSAGECTEDFGVESLVDDQLPNEEIALRVLLSGTYTLNHDTSSCSVALQEELFTTIRGIAFYHLRSGIISERAYEDCLGVE